MKRIIITSNQISTFYFYLFIFLYKIYKMIALVKIV